MDRPGCPGMPCGPGIPRSPLKMKVCKNLELLLMSVFIYSSPCKALFFFSVQKEVINLQHVNNRVNGTATEASITSSNLGIAAQ